MAQAQRKEYFIDRSFQARFIMKFCILVVLASCLIGVLLLLFSQQSTTVAIEHTQVVVKRTIDFFLPIIGWVTLAVALIAAGAVLLLTMYVSHKIAGPLYRIKRELGHVIQGDLSRNFKIREQDQLQLLSVSLNEMAGMLKDKHTVLKTQWSVLKKLHDQYFHALSVDDKAKLSEITTEIDIALNHFKV